jgi:chromosome segregation ATPase
LEELQNKLNSRNPFQAMGQSIKEYVNAVKDARTAHRTLLSEQKKFSQARIPIDQKIANLKDDIAAKEEEIQLAETTDGANIEKQLGLTDELLDLKEKLAAAEKELQAAGKGVTDAEQQQSEAEDDKLAAVKKFKESTEASIAFMQGLANSAKSIADAFGVAEDSELGMMIDSWTESLETVNTVLTATLAIVVAIESACWWMLVIAAVVSAVTTMFSYSRKKRLKEYNDEIERQSELLSDLQRAYNNLEDAMNKAFGSDYLTDLEQQRNLLEQEVEAYRKQAEAEKAKGKDMDKSAYNSYIESMKDAQEELDKLETKFSEFLTGNDIGSAATDFAEAWLDAYASFSNTTDAIKSKFKDMINNMVVNSIFSKIMENQLQPIFDYIDSATVGYEYNEEWWKNLLEMMDEQTTGMVNASDMAARYLEKYGISLRDSDTDLTGISRDIATASEESINGLAAGINTQNYYISYVPYIAEQTAKIVSLLGGNANYDPTVPAISTEYLDLVKLQNEHLAYLPQIAANTQATVDRCERAAVACESMAGLLGKVIKQRGVQTTYVLTTN